jgi:hypothetical protein
MNKYAAEIAEALSHRSMNHEVATNKVVDIITKAFFDGYNCGMGAQRQLATIKQITGIVEPMPAWSPQYQAAVKEEVAQLQKAANSNVVLMDVPALQATQLADYLEKGPQP